MSDTEYDNASDDDDADDYWYAQEATLSAPLPQTDRLRTQPPIHERAFQTHDRSSVTCLYLFIY